MFNKYPYTDFHEMNNDWQIKELKELKEKVAKIPPSSNTYSKTEINSMLNYKANVSDVYTKSQTDSLLGAKANAADVYTQAQTDNLLDAKADLAAFSQISTATISSSLSSSSFVYYIKIGRLCVITGVIVNSSSIPANTVLASALPVPQAYSFRLFGNNNNTTNSIISMYINGNGQLCASIDVAANSSIRLAAAYITT